MIERRRRAMQFVLLMGLVSLFADMCYQGARSAVGPYLRVLGASATAVGFVGGLGEAIGYGLRYVSGQLADRTRRYWTLVIAGYAVNLLAIPIIGFLDSWHAVAVVFAIERLGKAIRSPARTTLLSFAAHEIGPGVSFGVHEALDQLGAIAGPLLVAGALWLGGGDADAYRWAFLILAVPAACNLGVLLLARVRFPDPRALEPATTPVDHAHLGPVYWLYLVGVALIAFGLADWALLAFHLGDSGLAGHTALPIIYAAAMAVDGVAALVVGVLYDRRRRRGHSGMGVLAGCCVVGAGYAPLILLGGATLAYAGLALWAVTLAATESIAKAAIATLVPAERRGRAYGAYYALFGVAWWMGSLTLGVAYDEDPALAAAIPVGVLAAAAVVLLITARRARQAGRAAQTSPG